MKAVETKASPSNTSSLDGIKETEHTLDSWILELKAKGKS